MRGRGYVPDRGDLVWLRFDPQAGREQAGHRPALILSPRAYNERTRLALMCPVTGQVKGYPFEVLLPPGFPVSGAILADQVKSLDWRARRARLAGKAPARVVWRRRWPRCRRCSVDDASSSEEHARSEAFIEMPGLTKTASFSHNRARPLGGSSKKRAAKVPLGSSRLNRQKA